MATVLVIENDPDINDSTCEMLELAGHSSLSASDGPEGLETAQASHPDAILCDIWMHGMDGYEVLHKLRDNPATEDIPFIFFTASTEPSDVKRGLAMGACAYLCKPFSEEELLKTIERSQLLVK